MTTQPIAKAWNSHRTVRDLSVYLLGKHPGQTSLYGAVCRAQQAGCRRSQIKTVRRMWYDDVRPYLVRPNR